MITKGGLETITHHLAIEYAKDGIRVNAVALGAVYTPLHRDTPQDVMEGLPPRKNGLFSPGMTWVALVAVPMLCAM